MNICGEVLIVSGHVGSHAWKFPSLETRSSSMTQTCVEWWQNHGIRMTLYIHTVHTAWIPCSTYCTNCTYCSYRQLQYTQYIHYILYLLYIPYIPCCADLLTFVDKKRIEYWLSNVMEAYGSFVYSFAIGCYCFIHLLWHIYIYIVYSFAIGCSCCTYVKVMMDIQTSSEYNNIFGSSHWGGKVLRAPIGVG